MATVAPTTAGRIDVVEWGQQETAPAAAAIVAGTFVRQDTSGNWIQALATSAANAKGARLALRTVASGEALTAMKNGVVSGFTISQAYNVDLFLSDTGTLADAAGTSSVVVGRVVPGNANDLSTAHDKNVRIDCPL
jgi:ABC-type enterobactin transport system permease subunit